MLRLHDTQTRIFETRNTGKNSTKKKWACLSVSQWILTYVDFWGLLKMRLGDVALSTHSYDSTFACISP